MCFQVDLLTYFQLPNELTTLEQWLVVAHLTNITKWCLTKRNLTAINATFILNLFRIQAKSVPDQIGAD